jgi:hypothetical protein
MSTDSQPVATSLLMELYQKTKGDLQQTVSMYDLGATLGLARAAAGSVAEELMVEGLVELRTLSGGISITVEGLAALGIAPASPLVAPGPERRLSKGPVLDDGDRELLEQLLTDLRSCSGSGKTIGQMEEIFIDIKTIEVQLLSPAAKSAIIREVLRSLHDSLDKGGDKVMAGQLSTLIA